MINLKKWNSGLLLLMLTISVTMATCKSSNQHEKENNTSKKPLDQEDRLKWFKDAKFGMIIHWGPYSQLAGEWNDHEEPPGKSIAEWIMKDFKIPVKEYRDLAHKLNPVKFNAREWVRLAKAT